MRTILTILCAVFFLGTNAQVGIKPLETHIAFGITINHNTPLYNQWQLGEFVGMSAELNELSKQYWYPSSAIIRSYSVGAATSLFQQRNLASEWLFTLGLSGQFQHKHHFTGHSEMLVEHVDIDSVNSVSTHQKRSIAITEFNDLLTIYPGISFKHHVNRRWNVNGAVQVGIGAPIKTAFEVIDISYQVERRYMGDELYSESNLESTINHEQSLNSKPFYLAGMINFAPGIEFRLLDHRSIFAGLYGQLGRQIILNGESNQSFNYSGVEARLTSRF